MRTGQDLTNRVLNNYKKIKEGQMTAGVGVIDHAPISKDCVKALLFSQSEMNTASVKSFVFEAFSHKLFPVQSSIQLFQDEQGRNYATIVLARIGSINMSIEDGEKKGLTKISASSYLDQEIGQVWNKESIEGKERFVRNNMDDIDTIMEAVKVTASVYEIQGMGMADFNPRYKAGSEVDVYLLKDNVSTIVKGTVKSISGQQVVVKLESGDTVTVPSGSVIKTYLTSDEMGDAVNYMRKAFNPPDGSLDYAGKLGQ